MAGQPAHLKRITNKAKSLRKTHPRMKWPDLVSLASRQLNGKSSPSKSRKKVKKKTRKRKQTMPTRKKKTAGVKRSRTTAKSLAKKAKKAYEKQLADIFIKHFNAKKKSVKNKHAKKMRETKSIINKLPQ